MLSSEDWVLERILEKYARHNKTAIRRILSDKSYGKLYKYLKKYYFKEKTIHSYYLEKAKKGSLIKDFFETPNIPIITYGISQYHHLRLQIRLL
jgi:hypothetical protein